jgi:hypothetical protein
MERRLMSDGTNYDDLLRRLRKLEAQASKTSTADKARPIVARYTTASGASIANGAAVIMQYDTADFDPYALVTTGAAWKFTAPLTGYYRVSAMATFAATTAWALAEDATLRLFKSGAWISVLDRDDEMNSAATAQIKVVAGTDLVSLTAGEYIDVRIVQNSGGPLALYAFAVHNYIAIEKIN